MSLPHRTAFLCNRRSAGILLSLALLACFVGVSKPLHAQAHPQTANPQEKPVQHYVLLFRATRPFTPEEQQHRIADIAAWVKQVTDMGITLVPHTLGDTVAAYASKDNQPVAHAGAIDPTLANLVFFDSTEEQAAEIARLHPAPHYGVTLELRKWSSPAALTARP